MDDKDAALAQGLADASGFEFEAFVADLGDQLYQLLCAPGDLVLSRLLEVAPPVVRFAGLPADIGQFALVGIATAVWLGAILCTMVAYRVLFDLYVTIRGYGGRIHQGYMRVGRNMARRSTIAARAPARRREARHIEPTISEEVELGELEYAVLRCHGEVGRGHAMTAADLADALDVRISQTRKAIETLVSLQLMGMAPGAGREGGAYRLTPHGEGFLAACGGVSMTPVRA